MNTPEMDEVLANIGAKLEALYELQQEADRTLVTLKQEELDTKRVEAVTGAYANFNTINIEAKINDGTLAKTNQSLYTDLVKLSNDIDNPQVPIHFNVYAVEERALKEATKITSKPCSNLKAYKEYVEDGVYHALCNYATQTEDGNGLIYHTGNLTVDFTTGKLTIS